MTMDEPYDAVIERLRSMAERPQPVEGFPQLAMTFRSQPTF